LNSNKAMEKSTLVSVMMTSFATTFMGSSLNLALPAIGKNFSSSAVGLSWIVSSYILASAAFLLPVGRFADITGRRKIFLWGSIFFTVFSLLCAFSWSNGSMIFFRLLQGAAASMIYGTAMAILSSVYPPNRRGKAMGMAVTATYIGLSLGPVVGGSMCRYMGWRSIFIFTAIISLIAVAFIFLHLKGEWTGAKGEKFDFRGSILYMSGLVALLYGMSAITSTDLAKYIFISGFMLIIAFVYCEIKVEYPLIKMQLFTDNPAFAFSNLAAMINYSSITAIGFIISLYLQVVVGYGPQVAGLILISQPAVMALFSSFAGALSDTIETHIVASWGMGLSALGLFVFVFLNTATPLWLIVTNLALVGLGVALFASPNSNAIMGAVEPRFYGVASSTMSTMRVIGQATSMGIVTLLIAVYVGNASLSTAQTISLLKSFKVGFCIFSFLCVLGIFASLARKKSFDKRKGGMITP